MSDTPPAKRRGRPRKADLAAKAPGGRGKVGRPAGDAKIMGEYKAMMLTSPKSPLVLQKLFDICLDDEHKAQAACLKIVSDRLLPVSDFIQDKESKGVGSISITIGGATGPVEIQGEVIDHE